MPPIDLPEPYAFLIILELPNGQQISVGSANTHEGAVALTTNLPAGLWHIMPYWPASPAVVRNHPLLSPNLSLERR